MRPRFLLLGLLLAPLTVNAEPPAATIRVLVQNIYGRREKNCEERYRALAAHILAASPPYDIVAFNEHLRVPLDPYFSCNADVLTRAMESDGRYAGAGKSVRHLPKASGLNVSGGDSVFTLHKIVATRSKRFSNSKDFPLSGYVLARVELRPGLTVDFWDAHPEAGSDGCDDACRVTQGAEFAAAIEAERGSKNPVLLVGDFNTGGPLTRGAKPPYPGNGGYDQIMERLGRPRDLWLEFGAGEGFTFDCLNNKTAETCSYQERIDYVLVPESPKILDGASRYVLAPSAIAVVRWQTPSGTDVSDHYGLDATLELRARPAPLGSALQALGLSLEQAAPPSFDGRP